MNRADYQNLCEKEYLPVFYQPWWLDIVYGADNWEIITAYKGDKLLAIMPVSIQRKLLFSFMLMPAYTPYQGPWLFNNDDVSLQKRYSNEVKALEQLVNKIPVVSRLQLNFHYSIRNGLPFFWEKYKLEVGYTYLLKNLLDEKTLYKGLKSNFKREIKYAEKSLKITHDAKEDIFKAVEMTYSRQSKNIPQFEVMKKLVEIGLKKGCGRVYSAYDDNDNMHAALFIVWDEKTAYYLLGGGHPEFRKSGATAYLIWRAINDVSKYVETFDFEGSMVKQIEFFFRGFGPERIHYLRVSKFNNKIIKLKQCLFR